MLAARAPAVKKGHAEPADILKRIRRWFRVDVTGLTGGGYRDVPIPPLFRSYEGQKAQINIPTYDPVVIVQKVNEQTRSWGLTITSGYEHTREDLPGLR